MFELKVKKKTRKQTNTNYNCVFFSFRYIYTEDINITANLVLQILHASKKYNLPQITKKCTRFLEMELCPENACIILEQSEFFNEAELSEKCLEMIGTYTDESTKGENFHQISLPTLDKILALESVTISEIELFRRCLGWASIHLKKQKCPVNGRSIRQVSYTVGLR